MEKRLTVEVLRYYVPLFQRGDKAFLLLQDEENITDVKRNILETHVTVRDIALNRLTELAHPLMVQEVAKIIKNSLLKNEEDIFNVIYYAGLGGMVRGLRKFDVEKIQKSATNYLFQWITTYAKKEMLALESPFGIAPSRFYKYKKIAAVRRKMEEALEREVTNEEVLAYFHGGLADIQTMNGPLVKARRSAANKAMTLELVEEQDYFERNMKKVITLEVDDYRNDSVLSTPDAMEFSIIKLFLSSSPYFTELAKGYLYSELDEDYVSLTKVSTRQYRRIGRMWKSLLTDINGPFYQFLKTIEEDIEESSELMRAIEAVDPPTLDYSELFEKGSKV